jgi:hypothetical protein
MNTHQWNPQAWQYSGSVCGLFRPAGEVTASGQGAALDPLADRQQGGELVPGPGRFPCIPSPAGEVAWVPRVRG